MIISLFPNEKTYSQFFSVLGEKFLPYMAKSVKKSANMVFKEWKNRVISSSAKDGWKRRYSESIRIEDTGNPFFTIISAEGNYVDLVENGRKRYDLKPALLSGPHARQGKNGPYNIIFLRKGVANMKGGIHKTMGQITGRGSALNLRVTGIGEKIPLAIRNLAEGTPGKGLMSRAYSKKTARLEGEDIPKEYKGMVRAGAKGHSQYGTFRIVSRKSKGWIIPKVNAVPVFKKLYRDMETKIVDDFKNSLVKEVEQSLGNI